MYLYLLNLIPQNVYKVPFSIWVDLIFIGLCNLLILQVGFILFLFINEFLGQKFVRAFFLRACLFLLRNYMLIRLAIFIWLLICHLSMFLPVAFADPEETCLATVAEAKSLTSQAAMLFDNLNADFREASILTDVAKQDALFVETSLGIDHLHSKAAREHLLDAQHLLNSMLGAQKQVAFWLCELTLKTVTVQANANIAYSTLLTQGTTAAELSQNKVSSGLIDAKAILENISKQHEVCVSEKSFIINDASLCADYRHKALACMLEILEL